MPCLGTGRRGLVELPRELLRELSKAINTTEKTDPNAVTVQLWLATTVSCYCPAQLFLSLFLLELKFPQHHY